VRGARGDVGRLAIVELHRLRRDWVGMRAHIENDVPRRELLGSALLLPNYVRALGEAGDVDAMLRAIADARRVDPYTCLFAAAFAGEPTVAELVLAGPLAALPPELKDFWLGTAHAAAGDRTRATELLAPLTASKDVALSTAAERRLALVDHPAPTLEHDTDVLVRMLDVGICGTDREIARFDYGTPPPGSDYLVIGHESLARVEQVGSAVATLKPGDLVVTMVRRPCPHPECRACRAGRQDFCFTGDFTERGIKERHGFMTELVVDDERYMHVVPSELREIGVLVEPLTIAEKALIQVWDVQERLPWTAPGTRPGDGHGQRALVLGAGPVGLLGAMALLLRGFDTWVYSREEAGDPKAQWV